MRRTGLLIFVWALHAFGQIAAPRLGLVPDGASLRPVVGIPADAVVGSAIGYGQSFSQVVAAPILPFGLGVAADTGALVRLTADGAATIISGVSPKPDRIQFSPHGTAALVYFNSTKNAQVISGLPDNPSVRAINLSFMGTPKAMAVSDDGQRLASSWINVTYEFGPNGSIAAYLPGQALAYIAGGSDLGIVSATGFLVGLGPTAFPFLKAIDPVGAVYENHRVIVSNSDGTILTLQLDAGTSSTLDCQCVPAGLFAMSGQAYRISNLQAGAFKILDTSQNAIWFAPVALGSAQ